MFKLRATDRWYKESALKEADFEISAGPEIFPFSLPSNRGGGNVGGATLEDPHAESMKVGFRIFMRKLRLSAGLSLPELAKKIDVDLDQLLLIEQKVGYKPYPRTLSQLAKFYDVPLQALMQMAGSTKKIDKQIEENVVRFAAESESFEKLTDDERKALNTLVKVLRDFTGR